LCTAIYSFYLISGKSEPSGSPYTPPGFLGLPYPGYPPPPHIVSRKGCYKNIRLLNHLQFGKVSFADALVLLIPKIPKSIIMSKVSLFRKIAFSSKIKEKYFWKYYSFIKKYGLFFN
jgi:hypothetical protein